ncbi:MAG: hypothetical protein M5T52_16325 [Ignavibacteriaceae bacterium]|nr:hypothetical protein [Ignavibacteriaceae bacterium]
MSKRDIDSIVEKHVFISAYISKYLPEKSYQVFRYRYRWWISRYSTCHNETGYQGSVSRFNIKESRSG